MCSSKNKVLLFCLLVCSVMSCEYRQRASVKPFYDFDSLINKQVHFLSQEKPVVRKKAFVDGREEVTELVPADTSAWKRELDIFSQFEHLNKPVNRDNYKTEVHPDSNSKLTIQSFEAIKDSALESLIMHFEGDEQNIKKIEARFKEQNALFSGSRILSMDFEERFDKIVLTGYRIEGGQKMFLSDSVQFKMEATVIYSD